jgi:hypothetical protein
MTTDRIGAARPVAASALLIAAAAALADAAHVVAAHTIAVVNARRFLPRWDLATHLVHAWVDYDFLTTGRLHRLIWDLWLQGYWPPMHSIYQLPFLVAFGGRLASGLWSSLAAFVLVGLIGAAILWKQWRTAAILPAALYVALVASSPYLLAYGSVAMTEMVGALAQLVVLFAALRYRQRPGTRTARALGVSLTVLFFTKYNYFLLVAVPLVLHECLERTSGWRARRRLASVSRRAWRLAATPTGALLGLYGAALVAVAATGGFDARVFGQRISVHTVGASGHVVLYVVLARAWYLHRRGRIGWNRLTSADPRVRPLLIWFVAPVLVWLAAPYPNHIRDVANLVINRPLGQPSMGAGVATYLEALRADYFYREPVLAVVIVLFLSAAAAYRRQPPLMQWLILAVPIQVATIALHQTRFPRFLLLSVVLLCLAACGEIARWLAVVPRLGLVAALLAPLPLVLGASAARQVVTEERFRALAFEHYTDSAILPTALDAIRAELTPADRLAIVGQSNDLSPALFRWQLGPPSGAPCFPLEIAGAASPELAMATRVLLIIPIGSESPALEMNRGYLAARRVVKDEIDRGELVSRREIPVTDMRVRLALYDRRLLPAAAGSLGFTVPGPACR